MHKTQIAVEELTDKKQIKNVLLVFKNCEFLSAMTDPDKIDKFVEKLTTYGRIIAEYHDGVPVGFISFYDNNTTEKTAFINAFALDDKLGFLKGKTMNRLARHMVFTIHNKADMQFVKIEVNKRNKLAIRLYEHLGFEYLPEDTEQTYFMKIEAEKLERNLGIKDGPDRK